MGGSPDLVSVVVPAFNAEATIAETLLSVRRQTHRELDIVVVDDGSRDATREIALAQAAQDPRIRVVSQANAGVAAARNHGIDLARGDYIAPIDADDLWRPAKVERELRALRAAGPEAGLAYSWSAVIDEKSRVTSRGSEPTESGDVLARLFYGNFVGNGSCVLMRRCLVLEAGGYDPSLRARAAQGCEDWKLYLLLAERSLFAVVRDHLVGYRYTRAAMSGDVSQMLRSDALVRTEMALRHPDHLLELQWGRRAYVEWVLHREMWNLNWQNCLHALRELDRDSRAWRIAARRARWGAKYLKRKLTGGSNGLLPYPFSAGLTGQLVEPESPADEHGAPRHDLDRHLQA